MNQPPGSENPTNTEHNDERCQRISPHLRHKKEALSIWDYERLILEDFDSVRVAKCTNLNENYEPVQGKVKVAVISEQWTKSDRKYFSQSTLNNMKLFLQRHANSSIEIEVVNPSVESLFVNCIVEFMPEKNSRFYYNLLSDDLFNFLSPISRIENDLGVIGAELDLKVVSNFIGNRQYVQKLKDISVEHVIRNKTNFFTLGIYKQGERLLTSTPWSIFTPAIKHNIIPFLNDNSPTALSYGVENMEIGPDFSR